MLGMILMAFGVLILAVGLIAGITKNTNLMKIVMKRKPEETDEAYMKRATLFSVILGAGFVVLGFFM